MLLFPLILVDAKDFINSKIPIDNATLERSASQIVFKESEASKRSINFENIGASF